MQHKMKKNIYQIIKGKHKIKKEILVEYIFSPNTEGISEWKTIKEFTKEVNINGIVDKLSWATTNSNGHMRYNVAFGVKKYLWKCKRKNESTRGKIVALKLDGFNPLRSEYFNRPIRKDIKEYCKKMHCVQCGKIDKNGNIPDHKNDLYNDIRVLNINTQLLSDFQPMCNKCNLLKRAKNVEMRKTNIRPKAPYILLQIGFPEYIEGNESFDIKDINTLKGSYWYDINDFLKKAKTMITNNII